LVCAVPIKVRQHVKNSENRIFHKLNLDGCLVWCLLVFSFGVLVGVNQKKKIGVLVGV